MQGEQAGEQLLLGVEGLVAAQVSQRIDVGHRRAQVVAFGRAEQDGIEVVGSPVEQRLDPLGPRQRPGPVEKRAIADGGGDGDGHGSPLMVGW
ncbi:MAG: hypothetical protein V9G19_20835 [Tetrasphaera sp.]